ncbi:amino acid transporter [Rickenella mellea]|uniref:Amino acid transporter n=1 Tax=Rickenella mellea TaxID=50990 RepID=A0A4Y7QA41_9AGAM|nr:amino acid transporter [Rickenella mellea]
MRNRSRSQAVSASERDPLLHPSDLEELGKTIDREDDGGQSFDNVPQAKRQLGLTSVVFLIFNRIIGTGIFATPSLILKSSGSVGMTFVMWTLGALVAAAGTAVYVELGTGLPRSGGEKNYLEFIFRRPKFLMTCIYAMLALFIGFSSANAVVLGEYVMHAFSIEPNRVNTRLFGVFALTIGFLLHSLKLQWGLRLQNALGVFKLFVLLGIALCGLLCLAGIPGFNLDAERRPHNFDMERIWEGTRLDANSFVTGLFNVIWSFIGYSNANYALSEVRNPVRTIKRAAPLAIASITVVYMLVNVAYFAVVSKEEILGGGRTVAALFFRNLFGPATEKVCTLPLIKSPQVLSVIIALSTFGNVLAVMFTQGRVVQELGREGVLPYSSIFASNKPANAPFAGLLWQWSISTVVAVAPPPGDAYNFILNLSSYPLVVINAVITIGLLFLHTRAALDWEWEPPFRAWTPAIIFFLISNILLLVVPLVPPLPGFSPYEHLPYWLHVVVSLFIILLGAVYWAVWAVWLPKRGGYVLERDVVLQEDGVSRNVFKREAVR